MEDDAFKQVAQTDVVVLRESFENFEDAFFDADTRLDALDEHDEAARAAALARDATREQASDIDAALARLTDADQMGTLFKVLAIGPPGGGAPSGFVA